MSKELKQKSEADMSIVGHLKEVRNRVALVVLALLVVFIASFAVVNQLADALMAMGRGAGFAFVIIAPSEMLTTYFKLAFVAALVIVAPFAVYQIWAFTAPALKKREKKAIAPALVGGFAFFLLGATFCYVIALPFMLQFLYNFNGTDYIASSISIENYMNFVTGMLLTFGLVFEEPMLVMVLSRLGILHPEFLTKGRRYAIPLAFLIAALITPPDVVSQIMVGIPIIGLYEVGILICKGIDNHRKKHGDEDDEDEDEDDEDDDDDEQEA